MNVLLMGGGCWLRPFLFLNGPYALYRVGFREMTLQCLIDRIICNSLFLYLLSCRTFLIAIVSPVSMHFF